MGKGGFSWKRAIGVTRAKQRISRKTGTSLTKSGRQRKVGKMVTGGGCLLSVITILVLALALTPNSPLKQCHLFMPSPVNAHEHRPH